MRPRALLPVLLLVPACATTGTAARRDRARTLATEGVELQDRGRWRESLDRLAEAQSLYAAPTHLLYIARGQANLGRLLDAASTYRRLVGTELAPDAPPAFVAAREEAATELVALEQRLPRVRIEVEPANAPGLAVLVDGAPIPASWIGVDRAVEPGEHLVEVRATGWATGEARVRVGPAERRPVTVSLKRAAPGPAPAGSP